MIARGNEMAKDHGEAFASEWVAKQCRTDVCAKKAADADPLTPRVMRLFRVLSWVDASGGTMLTEWAKRMDAGEYHDLMAVKAVRDAAAQERAAMARR